jgi:hypothetical protein
MSASLASNNQCPPPEKKSRRNVDYLTTGHLILKGVTTVTLLIIRYLGCYIGCYRGVTGVLLVTPPLYRNSHFSSMLRAGAGIGTANYLAKKAKYLNQHKNKNL